MTLPRPPITVIVLTYQSAANVEACLAALGPQVESCRGELLVVDNASTDGTTGIARRMGVQVLELATNVGFAGGCNAGAAHASGETLLFVNPDCVVDEGAVDAVVDVTAGVDGLGPLGGRGHHPDGRYDPRSVHGRPSLRGALAFACGLDRAFRGTRILDPEHGPPSVPADGPPRPVAAVSGAFIAVPRRLWTDLEGFDERYFLYGEDVDLCTRARRLGWTPAIVPTAGYVHVGGASSGDSAFRDRLLYRGKVELYRAHLHPGLAPVAIVALQAGTALRGLPVHVPNRRLAAQAGPWWELFAARRAWRDGYPDGGPAVVGS